MYTTVQMLVGVDRMSVEVAHAGAVRAFARHGIRGAITGVVEDPEATKRLEARQCFTFAYSPDGVDAEVLNDALGDFSDWYRNWYNSTGAHLTVRGLMEQSYVTARDKGWHDDDDQPPSAAISNIAEEGLRLVSLAGRIEAHRKGEDPAPAPSSFNIDGLDDRQVRVIAWLALIATEVAEAIEDVAAGRWDLTFDADGKPHGLPSELADILIRVGDDAGAVGVDLDHATRVKLDFNKTRSHRHGGKLA